MAADLRSLAASISAEINARPDQAKAAIELLDEGATVPFIARYRKDVTGGLDDTIEESTGFKFGEYSPSALLAAIRHALQCWRDREAWQERMLLGMGKDFSWDRSAVAYADLYRGLEGK